MKSGFALEHAGWPALLINQAGLIIRANQPALKLFGDILSGDTAAFTAIWALDNGITAGDFLKQWEAVSTSASPVKLRTSDRGSTTFAVSLCSFNKDEHKFFILQVLPDLRIPEPSAPKPAAIADNVPGVGTGSSDTSIEVKVQRAETGQIIKQKLECALQLARTVSLDFNNALTSILGHTSLLLSQTEPNHPWRRSLLEVEKSAGKAAEIASDLAAFSRQEKEPRSQSTGNVNGIVQRAVELFQNSPGVKIDWTLQLGRKLFSVKFDEAKMQQAFMKIIENSIQAVGANPRISVATRNVELAEQAQDRQLRLTAGTYVCVEVSDNGSGIADEVLPRIFEPFFTTKKSPHRGLGLAWVYGIVTNHGGGVAVSSQPAVGTSVRVYLPADKKLVRETDVDTGDLKGNQTILMVDDEDILLTMGQTVLSAYGYEVLTASSGQQAIDTFSQLKEGAKIDLMITDLVMPGMSGRELVEHVRKISPQTQILCSSGFVRPTGNSEDVSYLQKPFTSQELLVKVKEALAATATPVD